MLNLDYIREKAADLKSFQQAEKLATVRKWRNVAANATCFWGEVKSSGAAYYKVMFELKGHHSKCNCPSRKKPCKHELAIMLLFVDEPSIFKQKADVPVWVAEIRKQGFEQKSLTRTKEQEAALAAQRLKTRAKRLQQMAIGIRELKYWLADVLRQGLAHLETQTDEFWGDISSRMVNAKCSSLANRIVGLRTFFGEENWHEKALAEIGELYLLISGFEHIETLSPELQQEVLNQIGIKIKKEDLVKEVGVFDTWLVVGQLESSDDERLFQKSSWIFGEKCKRIGLILEFVFGSNPYEFNLKPGNQFKGEVVFYPSAFQERVAIRSMQTIAEPFLINGFSNFDVLNEAFAEAIAGNPWQKKLPVLLEEVIPFLQGDQFYLKDKYHRLLPVEKEEDLIWKVLSLSGGDKLSVFGLWNGQQIQLLSAVVLDQFVDLKDLPPLPRPNRNEFWKNRF